MTRATRRSILESVRCAWCDGPIPSRSLTERRRRRDARFCGKHCRQRAYKARRRLEFEESGDPDAPLVFLYADPPYPGCAWMYRDQPEYAGEVDHAELLSRLEAARARPDVGGWVLSTSARALADVLPLTPAARRICAWCKTRGVSTSYGPSNAWEPVIVVGGRHFKRRVRDWLRSPGARGGDEKLLGRKPVAFARWLFALLGMRPGDALLEVFPGTAMAGRAWREASLAGGASPRSVDPSLLELVDVSPAAAGDASLAVPSLEYSRDASPGALGDGSVLMASAVGRSVGARDAQQFRPT